MAQQSLVHGVVDAVNVSGVAPDQIRCDLFDTGAGTAGMGCDVVRTKGRAFAPTLGAVIGSQADDDTVKPGVDPPTGKLIAAPGIG